MTISNLKDPGALNGQSRCCKGSQPFEIPHGKYQIGYLEICNLSFQVGRESSPDSRGLKIRSRRIVIFVYKNLDLLPFLSKIMEASGNHAPRLAFRRNPVATLAGFRRRYHGIEIAYIRVTSLCWLRNPWHSALFFRAFH
jgi:hypothetical protein